MKNLTSLNLSYTAITDAGLKEVAKLTKLKELALGSISRSSSIITDAGLKEVAKMENLTSLVLSYTAITAEGITQLKKALPKCNISTRSPSGRLTPR